MITYNPKDWISPIFNFHKYDTFRKLWPWMVGMSLYSAVIAFLEVEVFRIGRADHVTNLGIMHTLLGFAISMLLVFRTNTAYDRWWEGRKLWGSLVNNSRNLAIKLNAMLPREDKHNRQFFARSISLFADLLSTHLSAESTRLSLDEKEHPELRIDFSKHIPNQVADLIIHRVNRLYTEERIRGEQLLVLNPELSSFSDICGACERIKNTPIPFSYSSFIKKFIFIYVATLPIGYVFSLGYIVIPVVAFIFYVLASLELIAEEIEDPFGGDTNDLPTQKIASNIRKHVHELLD